VRWFWAIYVVDAYRAGIVTTGRAPTLDMVQSSLPAQLDEIRGVKGTQ
jgi:hypothetical protein